MNSLINIKNFTLITLICGFGLACTNNDADGQRSDTESEQGEVTYFLTQETEGEIYEAEDFDFYVEPVLEGLEIAWGMDFLPDGTMLVTEKAGNMYLVRDGALVEEPISNVPEVYARGQGGLMDVEIHPDYPENGWIYFSYSKPGNGGAMTSIMRARYDENSHSLVDREEIYTGESFLIPRDIFSFQ